jgi:hypothetical protein
LDAKTVSEGSAEKVKTVLGSGTERMKTSSGGLKAPLKQVLTRQASNTIAERGSSWRKQGGRAQMAREAFTDDDEPSG